MFETENQAKNYDLIFSEYPIHANGAKHLAEFIEGHEVLDLGSGTGLVSKQLENELGESVLLDSSSEMLKIAQENSVGDHHVQARFEDLENIFADKTFDSVVSNYAIHYAEDPLETVNSIHGKLRPGGRLILEDSSKEKWHESDFYSQLMDELMPERENIDTENCFDINQVLEESDFQVYETDRREYKLKGNDFLKIIEGTLYFQDPSQNYTELRQRAEDIDRIIDYDEEVRFGHTAVIAEK